MIVQALRKFRAEVVGAAPRGEIQKFVNLMFCEACGLGQTGVRFANLRSKFLGKNGVVWESTSDFKRGITTSESSLRASMAFFAVFYYESMTPSRAVRFFQAKPQDFDILAHWWVKQGCPKILYYPDPEMMIQPAPTYHDLVTRYDPYITQITMSLCRGHKYKYLIDMYCCADDFIGEIRYKAVVNLFWRHWAGMTEGQKIITFVANSHMCDRARYYSAVKRSYHTYSRSNGFRVRTQSIDATHSPQEQCTHSQILPSTAEEGFRIVDMIDELRGQFGANSPENKFLCDVINGRLAFPLEHTGGRQDSIQELAAHYGVNLATLKDRLCTALEVDVSCVADCKENR